MVLLTHGKLPSSLPISMQLRITACPFRGEKKISSVATLRLA